MLKGNIWQVGVVLVVFALVLPAVNIAYSDATVHRTTTENLTVDYNNTSAVSVDAISYDDTVTITNSSGATLDNGTDYAWNDTSGDVTWFNTSATSEGETATITYGYAVYTETTAAVAGILTSVGQWVGVFALAVIVGAALTLVFGGDGF